jgi:argininosuccinate synthase
MKKDAQKIVLAYSGGLDTSVILRWLIDNYNAEVIAFAADLGQGEELDPLDGKARKTGASKVYIEDLKEEFVRDFVFPVIKANLVYEGSYLLGTSIARPLIAKKQMEIAALEGADAVSHGATGKGNDQVRFELTYFAFDPNITVIAPWREWTFKSRTDLIEYSRDCKIPITVTEQKPYSSDRNLFHISFEGGILEDPWSEPPEDMFLLTVSPERAPDKPTYVELEFDRGVPVARPSALPISRPMSNWNSSGACPSPSTASGWIPWSCSPISTSLRAKTASAEWIWSRADSWE